MFESIQKLFHKNELLTHEILIQGFPFYNELPTLQQDEFRNRILRFMISKKFYGAQGFKVEFKHKVLVSAAATQLTFGLDKFSYPLFSTIILYEDVYNSSVTGMLHKGEANPSEGTITLSWKYFIEGYTSKDDKINLGLHEMAHAFFACLVQSIDEKMQIHEFLDLFIFNSEEEILKLRNGKKHLFREYAGENIFEFFAVAVEYFYEDPEDFAIELPELYKYLCLTLNQDSLKKSFNSFRYQDYFKVNSLNQHVDLPNEKILIEVKSKDLLINNFGFIVSVLMLLGLLTVFLVTLDYWVLFLIALLFVSRLFPSILEIDQLRRSYYFGSDHVYIKSNAVFGETSILGIPFSNIISVDFGDFLILNYINSDKLFKIEITIRNPLLQNDIKSYLLSKRIMVKSFGRRMPRLNPLRQR